MIVTENQSWRRPIEAHAEETYDYSWGEPQRSIMWFLKGKHQQEDADRLARGPRHDGGRIVPEPG